MNTAIPQASLQLVSDELGVTLHDARVVLEQYAEGEGSSQALERAASLLHTARGVLRMTETHGASLLAEEMEQTCAHLARLKRQDAGAEEPLEALMRAAVQLPAYVERVLNGGRDIPLVLLPLLNDLRAARGRPLLSESTLLLLNIGSATPGGGAAVPAVTRSGEDVHQLCGDLRPRFQLALLNWIRGEDAGANLRQMATVVRRLEQAAGADEVRQLWWVAGGIIEALLDDGLESSVSLKRLMGQVDREIKRLRTLGESQFAKVPPVELVNNLLYYVARARSNGARIAAIRAAFNLAGLVPGDAQVEQARQSLSAPSVKLMQTVAQAIREDLGRVKDVLDIFVRTGMERVEELAPQLELLKKIGDTLGVLGLGELREIVQRRREELQELIARGLRPDEPALVGIAAALLNVEDRLEGELIGMISPPVEEPTVVSLEVPPGRSTELDQVTAAVMRESLVNLARVKDAVTQVIDRRGDGAVLDAIPEQLQGIAAGLLMLGKERAAGVVESLQKSIQAVIRIGSASAEPSSLDRLADATVSLEYYLETLQAGRSDPNYMLDNAERCLAGLDLSPVAAGGLPDVAATEYSQTVAIIPPEYEATQVISRPAQAEPQPVVFSGGRERLDPELIELFIEEAREEIAAIGRNFPAWARDDGEGTALASLRRSFHTLKGSGRMVGADLIGEFCWSVERLLNRLIDGTVQRSAPLMELLGRCIDALPALLEQLETGATPKEDVEGMIASLATMLSAPAPEPAAVDGPGAEEVPEAVAVVAAPEPATVTPEAEPPAAAGPATGMDPVLLDIFTREVGGHLAALSRFVAASDNPTLAYVVTEELYRSCHTLNGSMAMARVDLGLPLTEALNNLVSVAYNRPARLPPGAIGTLRDTVSRLEALLAYLAEPWRPAPATVDLEQRLHDHLAAIEHPERQSEDGLERSGDVPAALVPLEEDVVADVPDDSSIMVEELVMPEVIELTGEFPADSAIPDDLAIPFEMEAWPPSAEEPGELSGSTPWAGLEPDATGDDLAAAEPAVTEAPGLDETVESPGPEAGSEAIAVPADGIAGSAPTDHPPRDVRPAAAPPLPYDAEIAAIFAEEAAELLEAADGAVVRMVRGEEAVALADLQRYLHTLKGGARMAGLTAMGDFSHDLETLLIRLGEGLTPRTAEFDALLQASLDELHRQREAIVTGSTVLVSPALAARLHAALAPAVGAEPVAEVATEAAEDTELASQTPPVAGPPTPTAEAVEVAEPVASAAAPPPEEAGKVTTEIPQGDEFADIDAAAAPAAMAPAAEAVQVPPIVLPALDRIGELARELDQPAAAPAAASEVPARAGATERRETARVDSALLDHMLNNAGELSIFQSRLSQQLSLIQFNLEELGATVTRLREQLRKLELETEAQILFRHQEEAGARADFDPLELDRYSTIQQLSRGLAESTTDVSSLRDLLQNLARDTEALLVQQARTAGELQDGLMRTRMVPFHQHAPRLARLVRQIATESGKRAELHLQGGGELDRQVLERMLGPFEHMLRNAVVHGVESPAEREAAGKPPVGNIFVTLHRDGSEAVLEIADDGRGLDVGAIRRKALDLGLLDAGSVIGDEEAMQYILRPGFSTADRLTQAAGRGIGMDVVASEVSRLGGTLRIASVPGRGTTFTIRLPFTLAVTQALIVRVGAELYALPLPTVEGVIRLARAELMARLSAQRPTVDYGGQTYALRYLGEYLGLGASRIPEEQSRVSVILVRAGEHSTALITDEMQDSREIVVKPVGPQLATIRGIAGATILGDGRIAVILDMGILVRSMRPETAARAPAAEAVAPGPLALVVDDSITMRRVTQRLLERNGFRVVTAKDGLEAIGVLQDHRPDIILLDIEMPRMDGYEFAKHVRNNQDTVAVPIVMITSRVSDKHRARAIEVGVNDYLGKPYQERQLLEAVRRQLGAG
jgi:chemosensory pili system protein ChpA (sensor histidine kinase/response regulator)